MAYIANDPVSILACFGLPTESLSIATSPARAATKLHDLEARSPIDGRVLARVHVAAFADAHEAIDRAAESFKIWRNVPAPHRGELVRRIGLCRLRDANQILRRWSPGKPEKFSRNRSAKCRK